MVPYLKTILEGRKGQLLISQCAYFEINVHSTVKKVTHTQVKLRITAVRRPGDLTL